jgi:hypothetical protein
MGRMTAFELAKDIISHAYVSVWATISVAAATPLYRVPTLPQERRPLEP